MSSVFPQAVDYFSLDVEGSELVVLETMDWSIPVRVWVIELVGEILKRAWLYPDTLFELFFKIGASSD